jgi:hypothetical protein
MGLGREIEFVVADGKKSLEREGIDCSVEVMSYFTVCIPYFNCTKGQNWCRRGGLAFDLRESWRHRKQSLAEPWGLFVNHQYATAHSWIKRNQSDWLYSAHWGEF